MEDTFPDGGCCGGYIAEYLSEYCGVPVLRNMESTDRSRSCPELEIYTACHPIGSTHTETHSDLYPEPGITNQSLDGLKKVGKTGNGVVEA